MEDQRVAEYFVIGGLPSNPVPLSQFSCDGSSLKQSHSLSPITDIAIINKTLGEIVPEDYVCLSTTPSGLSANLNYGVIRSQEIFLCFRRGWDKPPLCDIGVLLEGRESLMPDSQVLQFTLGNHSANINANGVSMYMTYRRSSETRACNELVVSDICIIMANKGDSAPHSYCTVDRNLNKGTMVGSDIYVCYKKSVNRTNYIAYKPGILDQYPLTSRPSFPMPADLSLFCLPMGATLEAWPPQAVKPEPVFSTFVLTVSRTSNPGSDMVEGVDKLYGAAITFYERYCHKKLTTDQFKELKLNDHFGSRNVVHTNKCICILSLWPFFDTFDKFLRYLLELGHSSGSKVPIERFIWHMLDCVPFPSSRRPRILIQLDSQNGISLVQPEDSPIPLSGASFRKLVINLHPEGCLQVFLFALMEQKILLHSLRPHVLTSVAEAVSSIIFPFHWQCPYIPLCPLGLSDILEAPIPFLIGVDSRYFDLYDPPSDVICIDLDTGAISIPDDKKFLSVKMLPKKAARLLKSSLESLCASIKEIDAKVEEHKRNAEKFGQVSETDFKMIRKEQELDISIQETFLRFMANILKGYSQFLLPIISMNSPDSVSLFDADAFMKSRDRSYQKFYEILSGTQMFSKFIEERTFVSDKNASLVFFDDCIDKLIEEEAISKSLKLLEIEVKSSEHTLFLPPPESPSTAPEAGYSYKSFPMLNAELFPSKPIAADWSEAARNSSTLGIPGSPLARRSKHEVKSSQKLASKHYQTPILWAKCLLATSFSVWFAHLPSFVNQNHVKSKVLDLAFQVLQRMQKLSLSHQDEVCYRVMMQLCGVYSKPVLAVKTLCEMKNAGITPNAITYGYYNRALLESKWNQSNLMWSKLRNVVKGVTAFRQSGSRRAQRRKSCVSIDENDKISAGDADSSSRISTESSASDLHLSHFNCDTLSSDPGYCSIGESLEQNVVISNSTSDTTAPAVVSSAGLLMSSPMNAETLNAVKKVVDKKSDLAEALSPTLLKYDQIKEPSAPINFESSPEMSADNLNSGKEDAIAKRFLNFVIPPFDDEVEKLLDTTMERTDCVVKTSPTDFKPKDNLTDIAEENALSASTTFFQRNTPQRLSNLWKKGIDGADGKIRGFWKKNSSKMKFKMGSSELPKTIVQTQQNTPIPNVEMDQEDVNKYEGIDIDESESKATTLVTSPEKDGRLLVVSGDPLGAMSTNTHSRKVSSCSLDIPTAEIYLEKGIQLDDRIGSLKISASESQLKQKSPFFDPPFANDRFNSLPSGVSLNSNDINCENSFQSWVPPFKLPLSGTGTYGLATSLASQGFRQATKHIESLRANYIDPTVTEWASPSNFNYRRSINTMRSAVTSFSRKYNEIKEALTTSPPRNMACSEDGEDEIDGFWNFNRTSKDAFYDTESFSDKSSMYEFETCWIPSGPYCLGIWLTSCSKCRGCNKILFDEEIMAGWSPDDNNLNVKCWHCNQLTLPLLSIDLYYLRHLSKDDCCSDVKENSPEREGKTDVTIKSENDSVEYIQKKGEKLDMFTLPYLSPLVLRKELETMLGHEGDSCLTELTLLTNHPILYWNMVWYFARLSLPSHLVGLCLPSQLLKNKVIHDSWIAADWKNVYVRCMWDNHSFHKELGAPLYIQWKENYQPSSLVEALTPYRAKVSKDVLQSFLTLIHYNKIGRCLEIILQELKKRPAELKYNHYPIYRDLLFFAHTTIPSKALNIAAFEPEFRREFDRLYHENRKLIHSSDGPPTVASIFCKRYFHDLSL